MLEFTFLGTSSGIPTLQRNVSGLIVKPGNSKAWCLVDCGEGTQHQLLKVPHSLKNLSAIFITHVHGDHCYGLPGLLATASMAGRTEPLDLIAPEGIEEYVRNTMRYTDMHMTYELRFHRTEKVNGFETGHQFNVKPIELSHRVPSFAYCFDEVVSEVKLDTDKLIKHKIPQGPLWGKIAKRENITLDDGTMVNARDFILAPRKPLRVLVGGDNDTPAMLKDYMQKAEVLIHEATYTQAISDKVGPGPQHSSAESVAKFAQEEKLKNLVLTHFSARYHHPDTTKASSILDVEDEAKKYYSGNLFLAQDLDVYSLSKDGELRRK